MILFLQCLSIAASASLVAASCGYNTHIHPREEGKAVEVNTFGYTGKIVST